MKSIIAILLGIMAIASVVPATPLACSQNCTIAGSSTAYNPPVLELASGSSVVWTSTDIGHINADGVLNGDACFIAVYSTEDASSPTTFEIVGNTLEATVDGETLACNTASRLPDGSFVLPYYCVIHTPMRGALVITA